MNNRIEQIKQEKDKKSKFFFILLLIFLFLGQVFIYGPKGNVLAGSILFGTVILLFFIIEKKYKIENFEINISKKTEIIIFILIILIASFFRIYKINEIPPDLFADEGDKGYQACKMIKGEKLEGKEEFPFLVYSSSLCVHTAATHIYLSAPFIKFFGIGKIQVKIPSIILGILAVGGLYFLIRNIYGVFPAIIGAFIISTMRWHVTYSRIAWENMISIISIILFLYFGWRAYTQRKLIDFILFGFALALAQYGYQSSRISPLWVMLFILYILFADKYTSDNNNPKRILLKISGLIIISILSGLIIFVLKKYGFWDIFINQSLYYAISLKKNVLPVILIYVIPLFLAILAILVYFIFITQYFRENFNKILLSILSFIIFFSPMGIYIFKYQFVWMSRGKATLIWNNVPDQYKNDPKQKILKTAEMYLDNIKLSFLGLFNKGDENPRWNFPYQPHLEFITGMFFIIGFLVFIKKFFYLKEFFILSALIALAQATFINTENPNASRTAILIPVTVVIIASGVLRLIDYFYFISKNINKKILYSFLILCGVIIGFNNFKQYFIDQVKNSDFQYGFSPEEYNMAMTLKKLGPEWRGVVLLRYELRRTFKYLMFGDNSWMTFAPYANIPIREDDGKNYIYMSTHENLPIVPILKDIYPNGEYEEFRTKYWPHKDPVYFSYKVPNSDIKNALEDFNKNNRGLWGYYYNTVNWAGLPVTVTVEPFIYFRHYYSPVKLPYSMDFKGKIKIDLPGKYVFNLLATSNSELYIDGEKIIQLNYKEGEVVFKGTNEIYLTKGYHKIQIKYNFKKWHMEMEFWWKKPGDEEFEVVPYKVFYRN